MPTNEQLAIILRLKDEASAAFQTAMRRMDVSLRDLAHKLRELGLAMKQIGANMTFVGAAITGPFVIALNTAAASSLAVRNTLRDFQGSLRDLQVSVAEAILPVLQRFADIVRHLVDRFRELDPQVRENALRMVFLTGVLLTVVGPLTNLVGRIGLLASWALRVFVALNPIARVLVVIGGVAVVVAQRFGFLGTVLEHVVRFLDYAVVVGKQVINVVLLPFKIALEAILVTLEGLFRGLAMIPQLPFADKFKEAAQALSDMRAKAQEWTQEGLASFRQFGNEVDDVLEGRVRGPIGQTVDALQQAKAAWDALFAPGGGRSAARGFAEAFRSEWQPFVAETLDLGKFFAQRFVQFFQTIESGAARSLERFITEGGKFKDFMRDFLKQVVTGFVQFIAAIAARILVMIPLLLLLNAIPGGAFVLKALDLASGVGGGFVAAAGQLKGLVGGGNASAGGGLPTKHQGGLIQSFQTGGEVLAAVQPGEFVVNRRATSENRQLLEGINRGQPTGGEGSAPMTVVFSINAIDTKTGAEFLMKNSNIIAEVVTREILRNNGNLRRVNRRFA